MSSVPVLKVVVAGNGNVGKTSLIRRFCEGKFEEARVATIGVDFQTQTVDLSGKTVKLSIWDMAGQDRFQVIRAGFYRGSRASALVYDVTEPDSLESLVRWRDEILDVVDDQPFVVVGNKIDLECTQQPEHAQQFADLLRPLTWRPAHWMGMESNSCLRRLPRSVSLSNSAAESKRGRAQWRGPFANPDCELCDQPAGVALDRSFRLRKITTRNKAVRPANPGNPTSSPKPVDGRAVGVGVGEPPPPAIASAVCVI